MFADEAKAFFTAYRQNYESYCENTGSLFEKTDLQDWENKVTTRAATLRGNYLANQKMVAEFLLPLTRDASALTEADYECLFNWTQDMYRENYDDPFILRMLLQVLMPHFKALKDVNYLIFLYVCYAYCELEISRTGDTKASKRAVEYYRMAAGMWDKLAIMKDSSLRCYVYIAFTNLVCVAPALGGTTMEESYALWKQFCDLRRKPEFCQYDDENPRIRTLSERIVLEFRCGFEEVPFDSRSAYKPEWLSKEMKSMVAVEYNQLKKQGKTLLEMPSYLVYNAIYNQAAEGQISWDEAYFTLEDYYKKKSVNAEDDPDIDYINFRVSIPNMLSCFLAETSLPQEVKQQKADELRESVIDFMRNYPNGINSYTLNNALQTYCFEPSVLCYIQDAEDKRQFVFDCVIARQPSTYLHCVMVARMAEEILQVVLHLHPEWLVGVCGCETAADVTRKQQEIRDYCKYAALFHDIGKNAMVDIVNNEYRQITDDEMNIVTTHPEKGASFLMSDLDFCDYADVALGHHRFYNEQGGYPANFDHRKSPVRFIIELVTICDSIDAATDTVDRHYRNPKNFDTVMAELRQGSGVQYNPQIVELIDQTPELKDKLRKTTGEERLQTCYEVYSRYFENTPIEK